MQHTLGKSMTQRQEPGVRHGGDHLTLDVTNPRPLLHGPKVDGPAKLPR